MHFQIPIVYNLHKRKDCICHFNRCNNPQYLELSWKKKPNKPKSYVNIVELKLMEETVCAKALMCETT